MKATVSFLLALCAGCLFSGCGSILDRSYDAVQPHTHQYWEDSRASVLRAENHQSLVNGLLVLISDQAEQGTVRLYGYGDKTEAVREMDLACAEVTKADAMGAYLVSYLTYDCTENPNYYEMQISLSYRRTAEQLQGLVNAAGADAVPNLLRERLPGEKTELAVKIGYCDSSQEELRASVAAVMEEFRRGEADWEMQCYPADAALGAVEIVEITWTAEARMKENFENN